MKHLNVSTLSEKRYIRYEEPITVLEMPDVSVVGERIYVASDPLYERDCEGCAALHDNDLCQKLSHQSIYGMECNCHSDFNVIFKEIDSLTLGMMVYANPKLLVADVDKGEYID